MWPRLMVVIVGFNLLVITNGVWIYVYCLTQIQYTGFYKLSSEIKKASKPP